MGSRLMVEREAEMAPFERTRATRIDDENEEDSFLDWNGRATLFDRSGEEEEEEDDELDDTRDELEDEEDIEEEDDEIDELDFG